MKKLIQILFAFLAAATAVGQGWYRAVNETNSLTCTVTNFTGTPSLYSVWIWNGSNGFRVFNSKTIPIPYTNFLGGEANKIYSLSMTVTSTNGIVSLPSTNLYVHWSPLPIVPGAPSPPTDLR